MNNIKKFRLNKNLSTYELADLSGISQSYVVALEQFKKRPTLYIARKISKALNIPLDELFPEPKAEINTKQVSRSA